MIVYRIGKTRFSRDLSGEGARLFGGRWNNMLTPCIYTSESRALALLEYSVNVSFDNVPRGLSITCIEIPDNGIHQLSLKDLPGDWTKIPAPSSTKEFGTSFLKNQIKPVLRVPSTIIPSEFNYILNPLHPDSNKFKIVSAQDFVYDVRIKMV